MKQVAAEAEAEAEAEEAKQDGMQYSTAHTAAPKGIEEWYEELMMPAFLSSIWHSSSLASLHNRRLEKGGPGGGEGSN